jgi:hypothetical protein
MMRILGLAVILFIQPVWAADPCCVHEDVAAAFLPHITYSREWPATFPLHIENPALVFIASSIGYQRKSTAVAWRSEMDVTQVPRSCRGSTAGG